MAKKKTTSRTSKKPTAKTTTKGPGVIGSIVEFLSKATATKPLTKDQLLQRLAKRFPDREPSAMQRTINCQVGARLEREQGVKVKKNDKGFWIA